MNKETVRLTKEQKAKLKKRFEEMRKQGKEQQLEQLRNGLNEIISTIDRIRMQSGCNNTTCNNCED